jgi:hypothetical protein
MSTTGGTEEKELHMCARIETIQVTALSGYGGMVGSVLWPFVGEAS